MTDPNRSPAEAFRAMASRLDAAPDARPSLEEGALHIAALFDQGVDFVRVAERLDALADEVRVALSGVRGPEDQARVLVRTLHAGAGLRGNVRDYYEPANSFLNRVLERGSGIPIALCVITISVASRLGMPIEGVSFPGHFLARLRPEEATPDGWIWIDAFEGKVLASSECAERWRAVVGPGIPFAPASFGAASTRDILVRMLGNLKQIYLQRRDAAYAVVCCDALIDLSPEDVHERRDRGLLYEQLGRPSLARSDLEAFLAAAPDDPSAEAVRARLAVIHGKRERLN